MSICNLTVFRGFYPNPGEKIDRDEKGKERGEEEKY
jgi:hypothetical protein